MTMGVKFCNDYGEITSGFWHWQTLCHLANEFAAANLVSWMAGQLVCWCRPLAQVMSECGKTNRKILAECFGLLENHQRVHARINFRVPLFRLWYAEQGVNFRK